MNRRAAITLFSVLALTGGITAAALDIVGAYLWRPLPYPSADRLVVVDYPRANGPSPRDLMTVDAAAVSAFADLSVASNPDSFTVIGGDAPFTVDGRWTSGDVFAMFAVRPIIGRLFTREEAARGEPLIVIGEDIWREHFGGRPDVVGRSITVRAVIRRGGPETFTIIGVMPRRLWHIEERTSLMLPLNGARLPWLMRLHDGIPIEDAAMRITAMVREQIPGIAPDWNVLMRPARDAHVEGVRPMLAATLSGVVLLALVAGANLAFLQTARGVARRREIAVRSVLGASRRDLIRQVVGDGIVVGAWASLAASLIAVGVMTAGLNAVEQYFGRMLPDGAGLISDWRFYALTATVIVATSVVLHLIMLVAARSDTLAAALAGHASSTDSPRHLLVRQAIVTTQIAVAFCLLVGAALMARTAWHLGQLDLGFEARSVLSANVTLHEQAYRTLDERRDFFRRLSEHLRQLPDVESVGLTGWLPFRVGPAITVLPEDAPLSTIAATMQGVDAGYFTSLRMHLRAGRLLTEEDRAGRDNAAVVSESLARALWGTGSPIGRRFRIRFSPEPGRGFGPYTVVGEVDDIRQSVMAATPPQMYLSFYQQPLAGNAFLQIKTRRDPLEVAPAVARLVRDLNPELALGSVTTLESMVERDGLRPRLLARAMAGFAMLAVAIAVIGLYAVSAWIAQLRRREAALRVALGAAPASVAALLAGRYVFAVGAGLAGGWIAAWPMSATLASELRGVDPNDPVTRIAIGVLLTMVSMGALLAPSWRASTSNLTVLLREE